MPLSIDATMPIVVALPLRRVRSLLLIDNRLDSGIDISKPSLKRRRVELPSISYTLSRASILEALKEKEPINISRVF